MSKATNKNRKKKKVTKSGFSRSYIDAIIRREAHQVRSVGGNCFEGHQTIGVDGIGLGLHVGRRQAVMDEVVRTLTTYPRDWEALFFVFFKEDGKERFTSLARTFKDATSWDLDTIATEVLDSFWEEHAAMDRISTGWCMAPSLDAKLLSQESDIVDYFKESGAWDEDEIERVEEIKLLRANKRSIDMTVNNNGQLSTLRAETIC